MSKDRKTVHPYIPNSVPAIQEKMLAAIGAASIDELYEDILRHNPHVPEPVRALCAAMLSEIDRCAGDE